MSVKKIVIVDIKTKKGEQNVDALTQSFDKSTEAVKRNDATLDDMSTSTKKASESTKNLAEDVRDNGGAIALLDSLTGGLASKFRDAAEATKLFNFSLKGTRGALIATGIGAIVVLLGVMIVKWDEITDAVGFTNHALERQNTLLTEGLGINEKRLSLINSEIKLAEARGEDTTELVARQNALLKDDIALKEEKKLLLDEEIKKLEKANVINNARVARGVGDDKKAAAYRAELNRINSELLVLNKGIVESEILLERINKIEPDEGGRRPIAVPLAPGVVAGISAIDIKKDENAELLALDKVLFDQLETLRAKNKTSQEIAARNEVALRQFTVDTSLSIAANLFGNLSALAKEGSAEAKALAVAQTLIDTYQSATASYKSLAGIPGVGPALGFAAAAAAVVAGLANVKRILAVDSSGETSAGGGGGNIGAPNFSAVGQGGATVGGQGVLSDLANQQNQLPVRSYVVANDVTTQQALERQILNGSTLGT